MPEQQYCLRWNNHHPNNVSVFTTLLYNELLVDVTLMAEGAEIHAHKLILSACSTYFQRIFIKNPCRHPIVILKDVEAEHLKIIIDFIYHGETNCTQDQLPEVLKIADLLKVKGLTEVSLLRNPPYQNSIQTPTANDVNDDEDDDNDADGDESTQVPVRPGPKKKLKTVSFQTSRSPDRDVDLQPTDGNRHRSATTMESENSTDSVEAQPHLPQEENIVEPDFADPSEQITMENLVMNRNSTSCPSNEEVAGICEHTYESSSTEECRDPLSYSSEQMADSTDPYACHGSGTSCKAVPVPVEMPHITSNIISIAAQGVLEQDREPNILVHSVLQQPQPVVTLQLGILEKYAAGMNEQEQMKQQYSQPEAMDNSKHSLILEDVANGGSSLLTEYVKPEQQNTSPFIRRISKRGRIPRPRTSEEAKSMHDAVEAVRLGMGFCKASRTYGVNNRALWLEYIKLGYPRRDRIRPRVRELKASK